MNCNLGQVPKGVVNPYECLINEWRKPQNVITSLEKARLYDAGMEECGIGEHAPPSNKRKAQIIDLIRSSTDPLRELELLHLFRLLDHFCDWEVEISNSKYNRKVRSYKQKLAFFNRLVLKCQPESVFEWMTDSQRVCLIDFIQKGGSLMHAVSWCCVRQKPKLPHMRLLGTETEKFAGGAQLLFGGLIVALLLMNDD